jgi:hypothetical protein
MDGFIVHGGIGMARGSLARIEDGRGILIYVWDGELHITQQGDRRDYVVKPGGWFIVGSRGLTVAHALQRTSLTLTAPVPSHYARRIVITVPGTAEPRVLYDRSREQGGWLAGLRHRAARLWTLSHYRFSNPTSAAL